MTAPCPEAASRLLWRQNLTYLSETHR